jgi:hypothetical protein
MTEFISPLIHGLQQLIQCEGYPSLEALFDAEKEIILRDLHNAKDDRELTIVQGRYKTLKKMRNLPTETVDKFLASQKSGGN